MSPTCKEPPCNIGLDKDECEKCCRRREGAIYRSMREVRVHMSPGNTTVVLMSVTIRKHPRAHTPVVCVRAKYSEAKADGQLQGLGAFFTSLELIAGLILTGRQPELGGIRGWLPSVEGVCVCVGGCACVFGRRGCFP